jgi:hypothetical protein
MCTPWASDWVVLGTDRAGFGMFPREASVAGAGVRFESHLGHA